MNCWWLVESSVAVEHVRGRHTPANQVWVSTSPRLLEDLAAQGERTFCPESADVGTEANALGLAAYSLAADFPMLLDAACPWRGEVSLAPLFAMTLGQNLYVTLYKGLLLSRALDAARAENSELICVGDPQGAAQFGLSLRFGRFDTLYAWLANRSALPHLKVEPQVLDPAQVQAREQAVVARRLGWLERVILNINAGPSAVVYKLWKALARRGLAPRTLRLRPGGRPIAICRDCELIEESFLGLLRRKARLFRLPALPAAGEECSDFTRLPSWEMLRADFLAAVQKALASQGAKPRPMYATCAEAMADRLLLALERLRQALPGLEADSDAILAGLPRDTLIISNALWSPEELLFQERCQARGVPFAAFEHGVTKGLSEFSLQIAPFDAMNRAAVGVYHGGTAIQVMRLHRPQQTMLMLGAPDNTSRLRCRWVQRILARRMLGISLRKHVVMLVADGDLNNNPFGPYGPNDLQEMQQIYSSARELRSSFPDSCLIIKLYPTQRYYDEKSYSDLAEELPGTMIIKYFEFRSLRAAADVVVVVSNQSTLGWAAGSQVPVLYYEFAWWPSCNIEGEEIHAQGINGLRRAIIVEPSSLFSKYNKECLDQLLSYY